MVMIVLVAASLLLAESPPPPQIPPRAPRARTDRGEWITSADYPLAALQSRHTGTVEYVLTVSPNGRVATCRVTKSSRHLELDDATCALIRTRGRFVPATNIDGDPVVGFCEGRYSWVLPGKNTRA